MQQARFLLMLLCAEWLLLFRTWVAPSVLFPMVLAVAIRAGIYMNIPHFLGAGILIYALGAAMVWHLRSLFSRRSSRNREIYQTPDTGVPWLVIVAQKPKLALALELGIVAAFIFFLHETPLNVPPTTNIRPEVQAWMYQNALTIANMYAVLSFGGLFLWNLVHFTQKAPSRDEMRQGIKFNSVRQQSHSTPRLQSIKDMVNQYEDER
jgi:hypothetical protein